MFRFIYGLELSFLFSGSFLASCIFIFFIDWLRHNKNKENCEINAYDSKTRRKIYETVAFNLLVAVPLYAIAQTFAFDFMRLYWNPQLHFLIKSVLFLVLSDICFFILHRIAHIPCIYQAVHKKHHEINVAFAPGAVYSTVWEMWFVNLLAASIPFYLLGFSDLEIQLFSIVGAFDTCIAHSRFSSFHFQHHRFVNTAFGSSLSLVDHVLKTFVTDKERRIRMLELWKNDPHEIKYDAE